MKGAASESNLSGTLTVPPDVRDILFSKARYVLNQRHIKRPWFKLNPFLEKTDESIDLENYVPEESKFVQYLESLVLCESLHSNRPLDTRELSIDSFFAYLNSDTWSKGCSIRVLEGQLLDQILLGLYRLEKQGTAVRHTTRAFANYSRPRTGCYKLAKAESLGSTEETLLIEFVHFGRLTKDHPNLQTLDPFEYLRRDVPHRPTIMSEDSCRSTELPELEERQQFLNSQRTSASPGVAQKTSPKRGHGSQISKHVNAISFVKAIHPDTKRKPVASPVSLEDIKRHSTALPPLQQYSRRHFLTVSGRQTCAVPSTGHDTRHSGSKLHSSRDSVDCKPGPESKELHRPRSPKNTKLFIETMGTLDFDDDDDDDDSATAMLVADKPEVDRIADKIDESDEFFGEEFYLSNTTKRKQDLKIPNVQKKLRQKRRELQRHKEEAKELEKQRAQVQMQSRQPFLPKIRETLHDIPSVRHETIKMPDKVPTFEEFVKLLKKDEQDFDPRFKNKVRLKGRKIAQRYYTAKGMHGPRVLFSQDIKNLSVRRSRQFSTAGRKQKTGTQRHKRRMSLVQEVDSKKSHQSQTEKVTSPDPRLRKHSDEVLAVTDSYPCKDHYLKVKAGVHALHALADVTSVKTEPSNEIEDSADPKVEYHLFPKASEYADENDAFNEESDQLDGDTTGELFDSKKLNINYSFDRLKKTRRTTTNKKPAFIEILAKYYSMTNTLRSFRKASEAKVSKRPRSRFFTSNRLLRTITPETETEKEERVIGKLKNFRFPNNTTKEKLDLDNVSRAYFSKPDIGKFHEQLREAIDNYVVRREIVLSNLKAFHNTSHTSVTFTKISCFQHRHQSCGST